MRSPMGVPEPVRVRSSASSRLSIDSHLSSLVLARDVLSINLAMPRRLGPSALAQLRQDADRYRWWALGVTTFSQAASAAVTSAIGPIAALLQRDFGISR